MRRWLALPPLALLVALCWVWWPQIRNEFFVLTGSRDEAGGYYGFHSGFGGSAYITLPVVVFLFAWHHQCGVGGCYWYARQTTAAGDRVCWRHTPRRKRTVEEIHAAHHAAVKARQGS